MNRHVYIVSNAFKAGGILLGLPALFGFFATSWIYAQTRFLSPAGSRAQSVNQEGLVQFLVWGARLLGQALSFLDETLQWLAGFLAVVCFLALCLALAALLIGRGIQRHQRWARIVGGLLSSGLLLLSCLGVLVLPRGIPAFAALLLTGGCAYSLWTLWRRYV